MGPRRFYAMVSCFRRDRDGRHRRRCKKSAKGVLTEWHSHAASRGVAKVNSQGRKTSQDPKTTAQAPSPGRQRREGFLLGFSHLGSLQVLFFLLAEAAKFRVAERFFVGIRRTVAGSFGRFANIAVCDGVTKLACQILPWQHRVIQIPQALATGTHRLGQAALDRITYLLFLAGLGRSLGELLLQRE